MRTAGQDLLDHVAVAVADVVRGAARVVLVVDAHLGGAEDRDVHPKAVGLAIATVGTVSVAMPL